jgi:fatty-acyl-CoA synthase
MRVDEIVRDAALVRGSATCATAGDEVLSFAELDRQANRMANSLQGLGLGPGDRLAWWSDLDLRALGLFIGAARAGVAFAPVDPRVSSEEAARVLRLLGPRVVVTDGAHAEPARSLGTQDRTLVLGVGAAPRDDLWALASAAAPSAPSGRPVDEHVAHAIYFTSGSTGRPKGVVVSHRAGWLRSFPGDCFFAHSGGPGLVCAFPLSHFAGWNFALECWQRRRPVHFTGGTEGAQILDAVERHRANHLYCIPALWERVLGEAPGRFDCSSLRFVDTGTSKASPELVERVRRRFAWCEFRVYYGSTEAGVHTSLAPADLEGRLDSVGRAVPGSRVVLGEGDEVLVANETMMTGYLDDPALTGAAFCDDYYRTGDVGQLDPDGYLRIVGRRSELIRTGGETVAPVEVETAVRRLAGVLDAAVVGLPDDTWGEVVCAALVVASAADAPGPEELRRRLAGDLAPHKLPRRVVVVDAIPRTGATGQVRRARLIEQLQAAPATRSAETVADAGGGR